MRTLALLTAASLVACAANPDPVPVSGAPDDLRSMAGQWTGEYGSQETARSGSIVFRLEAGRDTAAGDVVMIPSGARAPLHPMHGPEIAEQNIPDNQLLRIRFVRLDEGGRVSGELEPYHEPTCDCALYTTFTGTVAGDTVAGSYRTTGPAGTRTTGGWWRVVRR